MCPKIVYFPYLLICVVFSVLPVAGKNIWPVNPLGADECLFFNEQKFREIRERIDKEPYADSIFKKIQSSPGEVSHPDSGFDKSWIDWQFARDAALYYRISGDEKYLKKAVGQIVSGFQLNKPEKRLFTDTIRPNTYFWSWIMYRGGLFFAYDLIKTHPLFKPYTVIMNQRLDEVIAEGFRYKNRIVRLGNTQFWGITGLGIAGFLRKNNSAIQEAIEGKYGFKAVLDKFRDGGRFWPEPSLYSFGYVNCCLTILAEAAMFNNTGNLYKYVASNGASLPKMIESYTTIAYPNGQMITNGDNSESIQNIDNRIFFTSPELFNLNESSLRPLNKMEIYNYRLKSPFTGWLISQSKSRQVKDLEFWGHTALYYGSDISFTSPFNVSHYVFPEMGNAIVRSETGPQYWKSNALTVHFRNGASQQFHSHNDHFHFTLNVRGSNRYHDWYYKWDYLAPRKSNDYRNKTPFSASVLNHNTVTVDFSEPDMSVIKYAQNSVEIPGVKFSNISESNGMKIISARGEIYRGVIQTRTLGITADYVLDIFELTSESVHNYDYVLHSPGKLSWNKSYSWIPYEKINMEYKLNKIDEKSASPDNLWITESKRVTTNGAIAAEFEFEDGLKMTTYVLPEQNTELIDARVPVKIDGEGWDQSVLKYKDYFPLRKPMLIIRRRTGSTKFIALHCIGSQREIPSEDEINSLVNILYQSSKQL